ncbi:VOC family protein [Pseudoxanthomonas mexicana]
MEPRLSGIRQIAITVSDVDAALAFYRDVLGLAFLFQPAPTLAFLDADGIRLMLTTPQGAGTAGANSILYFQVQDIVPTQAALVARGATEERPPQLAAHAGPRVVDRLPARSGRQPGRTDGREAMTGTGRDR